MRKLFIQFEILSLIKFGSLGFISFLLIIIASKFVGSLFGVANELTIEFQDLTISILGFFLFALFKIIEKFSNTSKT